MVFKITSAGNNSTFGDLFYSVPKKEEIKKAEEKVINICNENEESKSADIQARLKYEFEKMCSTETAYHFLVLKEIAELSLSEGYPIIALGDLSGSIISYLLGITTYNPLDISEEMMATELVWGTDEEPIAPDFSIGIAKQVRLHIHKRLDEKFGFTKSDDNLFKHISMVDSDACETLGELAKATGVIPSLEDLSEQTFIDVANRISDESIDCYDFDSLLRLIAHGRGSYNCDKGTQNKNCFVTRDEFFNNLIEYNVPAAVALELVKKGVWSVDEKRESYKRILMDYNVPLFIRECFDQVTHLCTTASCVDRLLHECYISWYQNELPIKESGDVEVYNIVSDDVLAQLGVLDLDEEE